MRFINKITGEIFFGDMPHDMSNYEVIPDDGKQYEPRNGKVICLEDSPEYIAKQEEIRIEQLTEEYLEQKDSIQKAMLNDKSLYDCGIISESVYNSRTNTNNQKLLDGWNGYWQELGKQPPTITE